MEQPDAADEGERIAFSGGRSDRIEQETNVPLSMSFLSPSLVDDGVHLIASYQCQRKTGTDKEPFVTFSTKRGSRHNYFVGRSMGWQNGLD